MQISLTCIIRPSVTTIASPTDTTSVNIYSPAAHDGREKANTSLISFVRSGGVNIGLGQLRYSGQIGYSWASRTRSMDIYTYTFGFVPFDTRPSLNSNRFDAFPLRCLSTV